MHTCATSRAVHLDLLPDMTAEELKGSLTEFVARRGRPAKIVSDNAKTFVSQGVHGGAGFSSEWWGS